MSKWLAGTDLLQGISRELLQGRQEFYSEEAIRFKMIEHPELKYRAITTKNSKGQHIFGMLVEHREVKTQSCIVFMHGLASNTLEAVPLIDHLLPNTALFAFDFTGSGRSGGNCCTYGLKQSQEIANVLSLLERQGFKQFVLWGRSMGAVACLLYNFTHKDQRVIMQVVDSPFCTFETVCEGYAKRFMGIPQILVIPALSILKQAFSTHPYTPFKIGLPSLAHKCITPTIFVYNQKDDVIPASNTEAIIKQFSPACYYERISISEPHNHLRSSATTALLFQKVRKLMHLSQKSQGKRRGFDVLSNRMKRKGEYQSSGVTQVNKSPFKQVFRRSAIYCSLSKKSSGLLSTKDNPQRPFLDSNF